MHPQDTLLVAEALVALADKMLDESGIGYEALWTQIDGEWLGPVE